MSNNNEQIPHATLNVLIVVTNNMEKFNSKKFWLTTIASFVFITVYEMIVHSILLKNTYDLTPALWRPEAEMNIILMMVGYLLMAAFLVCLFGEYMKVRSMKQGAKAGVAVGLPLALAGAMSYLWMPISAGLAVAWFVATFIKLVAVGKITGMVYKKD